MALSMNRRAAVRAADHGAQMAERVRFELTGLSSSGFQVWVRAFAGVRGGPIHEAIGCLPGLESAGIRPCCYRLLLPVDDPGFATTGLRQMPLHIVSQGCSIRDEESP